MAPSRPDPPRARAVGDVGLWRRSERQKASIHRALPRRTEIRFNSSQPALFPLTDSGHPVVGRLSIGLFAPPPKEHTYSIGTAIRA